MADDKDLDHPDYQGAKGVWNKTLGRQDEDGRSFAGIAAQEIFNDTLGVTKIQDEEKGTESKMWSPFMHSLIAGVLTVPLGFGSAALYQVFSPEDDTSFQPIELTQTGELQDGYSAISISNFGNARYVLYVDDGQPQLYRVLNEGDQIEYVAQQQDAHEIMSSISRRLNGDHNQMTEWLSAESPNLRHRIDFDVNIDTLDQVSLPHTTAACDAPCVTRDVVYSDVDEAHDLSTVYAQKAAIWSQAAEIALTSEYGFTPEQSQNIEHDVEGGEAFRLGFMYSFLGALGFTLSWATKDALQSAVKKTSPTTNAGRRQRRRKRKEHGAKPA